MNTRFFATNSFDIRREQSFHDTTVCTTRTTIKHDNNALRYGSSVSDVKRWPIDFARPRRRPISRTSWLVTRTYTAAVHRSVSRRADFVPTERPVVFGGIGVVGQTNDRDDTTTSVSKSLYVFWIPSEANSFLHTFPCIRRRFHVHCVYSWVVYFIWQVFRFSR